MRRPEAYQIEALGKEIEIGSHHDLVQYSDSKVRWRRERRERRERRLAPVAVAVFVLLQSANILIPRVLQTGAVTDGERFWELREELAVAVAEVEAFSVETGGLPASLRSLGAQYDERWHYEVLGQGQFRIVASDRGIEMVHDSAEANLLLLDRGRQARAATE